MKKVNAAHPEYFIREMRCRQIVTLSRSYLSIIEYWLACELALFRHWNDRFANESWRVDLNEIDSLHEIDDILHSDAASRSQVQVLKKARNRAKQIASVILTTCPMDRVDEDLIAVVASIEDEYYDFGGTESSSAALLKSALANRLLK